MSVGGSLPVTRAIARQFAHGVCDAAFRYAVQNASCHDSQVTRGVRQHPATRQERVNAPRRLARSQGKPTPQAELMWNISAAKRLNPLSGLELTVDTVDFGPIHNLNEGKKTCLKLPGLSHRPQFLVCPPVPVPASVTPIWNAALSALALALWPLTFLTRIRQQQLLPVWPLACCVTTLASAAAQDKTARARRARRTSNSRRRGFCPGGGFAF